LKNQAKKRVKVKKRKNGKKKKIKKGGRWSDGKSNE
jgi:hypothetical protein